MNSVVIVGAGPAGLAAADAALRAGAEVTLLDAAAQPGGQFHRMLPIAYAATHPERVQHGWSAFEGLRRRVLEHPRCAWWSESTVWAIEDGPRVHVLRGLVDGTGRARHVLEPDALVLATGAHDRVLPFPGWQLPGVFSAGAAQALAKGERVAVGERVVVAGSGPFLLPVTAALSEAGSRVLAVLEANSARTVLRGWGSWPRESGSHRRGSWAGESGSGGRGSRAGESGSRGRGSLAGELGGKAGEWGSLWRGSRAGELGGNAWELVGKVGELLGYAVGQARHRVPYRMGRAVIAARGDGRVEEVVVARLRADWSVLPGSERTVAVDAVCVSHGFSPQLELAVAAGCALSDTGFVDVGETQMTTVTGVYAAGEITGIAGARAAAAEGAVAGWCAVGREPSAAELRRVAAGRAFAGRLARAHPIGAGWSGWLRPDTVICRCEETSYAALREAAADPSMMDSRALRLATRAGLGPCQARICGPTVAELTGSRAAHRRPIAQPIRLGELAEPPLQKED